MEKKYYAFNMRNKKYPKVDLTLVKETFLDKEEYKELLLQNFPKYEIESIWELSKDDYLSLGFDNIMSLHVASIKEKRESKEQFKNKLKNLFLIHKKEVV